MLKKLLAAAFAATLVLGAQTQAADSVWNGTAWVELDGTTPAPLPAPAAIGDGAALNISNATATEEAGNIGVVSIGAGGGGASLTIGESSGTFTPSSALATGPVNITATSITTDGAAGNSVTVKAGSTLNVTGNVALAAATDILSNAGTMVIGGNLTNSGAAGTITNTGTLTLAGTGAAGLGTALAAGNIGTINLNGAVTAFVAAGTTAGTVNIANQTAPVAGAINVGGAALNVNGGVYSGAITAETLTAKTGTTTIGAGAVTLGTGLATEAAGTIATGGDLDLSGKTVTNAGTIEVASGNEFKVTSEDYTGGGTIKNLNAAGGAKAFVVTSGNSTIAAAEANAILGDLARASGANIGNVQVDKALGGNVAVAAQAGLLDLQAAQAAAVSVDVGAANLLLSGGGEFNDVKAGTIQNTAAVDYKGAIRGNLNVDDDVAFKTGSTFANGNIDIADTKTLTVETGSTVTVSSGKGLTVDVTTSGGIVNTGGTFTVEDGATAAAITGTNPVFDINGAGAVTNFNGSSANLLATVKNQNTDFGTINIGGDMGDTAVDFSANATGGAINFNAAQANNTKVMDFGATDVSFLAGDSTFTNTFDAATITIGDTAGTKTASVAFGNATAGTSVVTGAITVNKGSTFATAGADTTLGGTASLDVKDGGIIAIGNNGSDVASTLKATGGAQAITVDANSKLAINNDVRNGDVFDANFVSSVLASGMTQADFEAWLDANVVSNVLTEGKFELDSGRVKYTGADQTNVSGAIGKALATNGAADFAPQMTNTMIDAIVEGSKIVASEGQVPDNYTGLSDKDKTIVNILDALGGSTNAVYGSYAGRGKVAYAGYSWLGGYDLANSFEAVQDTVKNFTKAVSGRAFTLGQATTDFASNGAYGAPLTMLDCNNYANRIWAGYTGMWGDADARGGDRGYKYDAHGFNVGYDRAFSNGFSFGGAFGYSKGDFDLKGGLASDSDIDNYSFALYGSWMHCSGLFTTLIGSYTYSDYDMNNQFGPGVWDRADYHSDTWSIGGEVGYEFRPVQNFALIPSIGLYYYDTSSNRFNTSSGRLGMKYDASSLEMPIEVTAKYDICLGAETNLTLIGKGGYTYNFRDKGTKIDRFVMSGTGIVSGGDRGRSAGHSGWNVGGGANLQYRNFDFGVNYEYNARSDYDSHNLWVNAGIRF